MKRENVLSIACGICCTAAIALLNVLFAWKYFSRLLPHGFLLGGAFALAYLAVLAASARLPARYFTRAVFWLLALAMAAVWIVAQQHVPESTLRVDRWQMVALWWDNLLSGRHPYIPLSPDSNIPGPFPVLFLLAAPFYLLRQAGLFPISGVLLLFLTFNKIFVGDTRRQILTALGLFLLLPVQWEVVTRSTLLVNMAVVLFIACLFDTGRWKQKRHIIVSGLVGGLALCTRSVAAIPMAVSFVRVLRSNRLSAGRFALFVAAAGVAFVAVFAPLFFWHPAAFAQYNPFSVQDSLLPYRWLGPAFVLIACGIGWAPKTFPEIYGWCGILMFALVTAAFAASVAGLGWHTAFFESKFDISYYILSVPFLVIAQWIPKYKPGAPTA